MPAGIRERMRGAVGAAALLALAGAAPGAQSLADLMAMARVVGAAPVFENDHVRVSYVFLEYPAAPPRVAESRPVVVSVRVDPRPGVAHARVLDPPRGARPSWRPGVNPRGVRIEVLTPPPPPPALGQPGTDPPRDAVEEARWDGGRLMLATFAPFGYGAGTGRFASVTVFLSDGVVEVTSRGIRRRMGVQAGDAFWFEPTTRLTVVDDYPVGAAIVQFLPK